VRNPMNPHQIRRVNLDPEAVDCIVFWSKNPEPMLDRLNILKDYTYYFQFTLNPYDSDIEAFLPPKKKIIKTFKKLSDKTSPVNVIWRYDPIFISDKYTLAYHTDKFSELARELKEHTEKIIFSFIDFYKKIGRNLRLAGIRIPSLEEKIIIAENFSRIASENGLFIDTCAENIDLSKYGINHARCIDDRLIAKITGYNLTIKKDKNQRHQCGCAGSIDIGEYNSCTNGCIYCYASRN